MVKIAKCALIALMHKKWTFALNWRKQTSHCKSRDFLRKRRPKITRLTEKKQNKKSNGEQSDLCDLEQVTLLPLLQVHLCLTTWLQIWYHSLLRGDSIRKGLEKQNCLFGVHPAVMGKLTTSTSIIFRPKFHCVGEENHFFPNSAQSSISMLVALCQLIFEVRWLSW